MKITFLGAAHEVTGSLTLVEVNGERLLIDCGMEQGRDIFINQSLPVSADSISCVLLTHAHIDHSGNLPLLCKNGFRGKIYATAASCNLCNIMLRDSAHIQESEAVWRNRKSKRADGEEYEPIYTLEDAEDAISRLRPVDYGESLQILEGVTVRFTDIGHLLGSAAVEVWLSEKGITRKIVFSGDIGNVNKPLLKDPGRIREADYVMMESTYGDRYHEPTRNDCVEVIASVIQETLDRGGNVIIPSFAVGRTQEILYLIRLAKLEGRIKGHDRFRVVIDSPLASEATGIFLQCDADLFDDEAAALLKRGVNPLWFDGLETTVSTDESRALNFDMEPKVIISASGMCEAGRIRHHLKHNLWRSECSVLFVGYQGEGTLGRSIIEGAKSVKLFGESIAVKAQIRHLNGASGHADKQGLLDWINAFEKKPLCVFVNHGDDESCRAFSECLSGEYGYNAHAPYSGTEFDLAAGEFIKRSEGVPVSGGSRAQARSAAAHNALVSAAEALEALAKASKQLTNADKTRFEREIRELTERWSRT